MPIVKIEQMFFFWLEQDELEMNCSSLAAPPPRPHNESTTFGLIFLCPVVLRGPSLVVVSSGAERCKCAWMWMIQEALAKSSPAESRIRADTEAAVRSMRAAAGAACSCTGRPAAGGDCRRCMLRRVAERLRDAGYNSALCTSKWTRSPDIPSGNPRLGYRFFLPRLVTDFFSR
jgi:hypothetical protein